MAKVYIVNDMNHSFHKAERFGELRYVTEGKVPIFRTDTTRSIIAEGLKDFNVKEDYLLLSGHILLCVMAALHVLDGDEPIRLLVFDAKEQDYTVRHISI